MTPQQVKALLSSKRSADRRLAGREITANPKLVSRAVLEAAWHNKTVPQIRNQFAAALGALDAKKRPVGEPPAKQAKAIYDEAFLRAMRTVTQSVLHQLSPLIGDIEQAATAEIGDFEASNTKTRIGQIKLHADAIAKLYNAAKPAMIEEFDLAAIIRNCLPHDLDHQRCEISFAGPAPLMAQGDPSLITIAVTNGLRNAIEACLPVAADEQKPHIVINWNATDEIIGFPFSMRVLAIMVALKGRL